MCLADAVQCRQSQDHESGREGNEGVLDLSHVPFISDSAVFCVITHAKNIRECLLVPSAGRLKWAKSSQSFVLCWHTPFEMIQTRCIWMLLFVRQDCPFIFCWIFCLDNEICRLILFDVAHWCMILEGWFLPCCAKTWQLFMPILDVLWFTDVSSLQKSKFFPVEVDALRFINALALYKRADHAWSLVGLIFASCVQNFWIWIRIWYYPGQSWTFWGVCMPGRWKRSRWIRWMILQNDQDKECKFSQCHTWLYVSAFSVHHLHAIVWMCLSMMNCQSYPKKIWMQLQDLFWIDFFCAGIHELSRLYTGWSMFAKLTEGQCVLNWPRASVKIIQSFGILTLATLPVCELGLRWPHQDVPGMWKFGVSVT